ncbi:MAG: preprotein translocase subunit SecA [Cryobacterium sp.]|jgi:primosomal protein N' (replication factor Y)|nr:preprotein translocase subunit SecA [Cryobacterium sp.]
MATGPVARVLIDSPLPQLDHLFDYRVPDELAATAVPGVRVKVPWRSAGRTIDGYIIDVIEDRASPEGEASGSDPGASWRGTLSAIEAVVSPVRVLTPEISRLARLVADRAAGNAGDIIRLAVPSRQVRVEKAWIAARAETAETADVAVSVPHGPHPPRFSAYPPGALDTVLADSRRAAVQAVPRLEALPDAGTVGAWAITLAELAAATVDAGRSAILVVPDYRDQDQVQAALARVAPADLISRLDARQPNADRYRAFLACLEPGPRIIIGNRSAVYAPAADLGLLALWDDGDPLHAEPLSPYVHSRDAALVRQQEAGCALVLLGHSRSVEAQRLVELGWLDDIHPQRNVHPRVIPTDFQVSAEELVRAARIPSAAWQVARAALATGPVLVQVASPGYAPVLACQTCRRAARCTRCQGPLGLAAAGALPACRWCGALAADWVCTHCEGRALRQVSVGAARTAEDLGRAFPGTRIITADGDHPLQHVDGEPALVIATRGAEPLAPRGYQGVLLLDGERMLARESLRVGEDCLRWWSNAAALAAPGASVMLVGVGGALARAMNTWQQPAYAARELVDRRSLRFPPAVRVASVSGAADDVEAVLTDLTDIPGLDVLGPAPTDPGLVRAILRFPYGSGDDVAHTLKAAVVRNATRRRKPKSGAFRAAPTLKVRFDDPELL